LHITVFYLHYIKVHPNVDHQHLVKCVIYHVFGHKTRRVWYVNITSHGDVCSSDTRVVFKHTSNAGMLRNVRHIHDASGVRWCCAASRARWLIDASVWQAELTFIRK